MPFVTQQIAGGADFTDREREVGRVLDVMRTAGRLVVYGERRMGKSSLIMRAAERLQGNGGVALSADAWGTETLDQINNALYRALPRDWLVGDRLASLLRSLRSLAALSVDDEGRPTLQLSGTGRDQDEARERLQRLLKGIDRIAASVDTPVVVVIDEFQRFEDLEDASVGLLRSLVQHTPNVAYIFSGSIVGLVSRLLSPSGPFHAIERLEVGAMDPEHLVPWIEDKMEVDHVEVEAGTGSRIWEMAGPVTEYVLRLAKVVYRRARQAGRAAVAGPDLVEAAFQEVMADFSGSFELIWAHLSPSKKKVLRAVADGEQHLNARDVIQRYGLGASSVASYAINELRDGALLAPSKPYRISDPFLAGWIRDKP